MCLKSAHSFERGVWVEQPTNHSGRRCPLWRCCVWWQWSILDVMWELQPGLSWRDEPTARPSGMSHYMDQWRGFPVEVLALRPLPLERCAFGTRSECRVRLQARLHRVPLRVPVSALIDPLDSSTDLDPNVHMFRPQVWSIHHTPSQWCAVCCVFVGSSGHNFLIACFVA